MVLFARQRCKGFIYINLFNSFNNTMKCMSVSLNFPGEETETYIDQIILLKVTQRMEIKGQGFIFVNLAPKSILLFLAFYCFSKNKYTELCINCGTKASEIVAYVPTFKI